MDYELGMWVTAKHNIYFSNSPHDPDVCVGASGQIIEIDGDELTVNFCYNYKEEFGNYIYKVLPYQVWTDKHYMHDLNIGDRVVSKCHGAARLGHVIAVRRSEGFSIGVQCDEFIDGHSCNHGDWWNSVEGSHRGEEGHCWWNDVNYVFKISPDQEANYKEYYHDCLHKLEVQTRAAREESVPEFPF